MVNSILGLSSASRVLPDLCKNTAIQIGISQYIQISWRSFTVYTRTCPPELCHTGKA